MATRVLEGVLYNGQVRGFFSTHSDIAMLLSETFHSLNQYGQEGFIRFFEKSDLIAFKDMPLADIHLSVRSGDIHVHKYGHLHELVDSDGVDLFDILLLGVDSLVYEYAIIINLDTGTVDFYNQGASVLKNETIDFNDVFAKTYLSYISEIEAGYDFSKSCEFLEARNNGAFKEGLPHNVEQKLTAGNFKKCGPLVRSVSVDFSLIKKGDITRDGIYFFSTDTQNIDLDLFSRGLFYLTQKLKFENKNDLTCLSDLLESLNEEDMLLMKQVEDLLASW